MRLLIGFIGVFITISLASAQTKEKSKHLKCNTATDTIDVLKPVSIDIETKETIIEEKPADPVFIFPEQAALFNGKGINEFRDWATKKIKYPRAQMEQGVSGKVFIQFIIDTLGVVNNIRILRGVDPSIDAEAIRVIKLSPLWLPAKQNGRKVKQEFTIPLNFELPKKE